MQKLPLVLWQRNLFHIATRACVRKLVVDFYLKIVIPREYMRYVRVTKVINWRQCESWTSLLITVNMCNFLDYYPVLRCTAHSFFCDTCPHEPTSAQLNMYKTNQKSGPAGVCACGLWRENTRCPDATHHCIVSHVYPLPLHRPS